MSSKASTSKLTQPDLDALFEASLEGYRNGSGSSSSTSERHFGADENVIRFDDGDSEEDQEDEESDEIKLSNEDKKRKRPSRGKDDHTLPVPTTHTRLQGQDKGKGKIAQHLDELESPLPTPSTTNSSSRRKAAPSTAGSQWFDMPAFPSASDTSTGKTGHGASSGRYSSNYGSSSATAEEMRREVQAIRLRNALDPKRHYKGSSSKTAMPQFAQLGKIIGSNLEPNNTLSRSERGNTVIEELMKDAKSSAYAKKKYAEHQVRTSAGGKGHFKAKSRKNNDRERKRARK
ncbi:unnamed protein product [Sympodiomycopsis kandeliae]